MGLDLTVGMLPALAIDPEGIEDYQHRFERVNQALEAAGLPSHHEPTAAQGRIPWFCQMWGYSGLHYLRRFAAYLWAGEPMPAPATHQDVRDPMRDPIMDMAYSLCYPENRPFAAPHLLFHSDSTGFYLPQDFEDVIYPARSLEIPGDMIGSAAALQRECTRLARALEIPPDLDPEDPRVWDAAANQGTPEATMWQYYGMESFTCVRLLRACEIALESGCAIVFH